MNLKSLATLSGIFFVLLLFAVGCQQEDQVAPGSKLTFRAPPECITNDPVYTFNTPCPGEDLTVTVCFPANCGQAQIQYEESPGVWTQIAQVNPLTLGCLTGTLLNVVAGTYNFRTAYQSSGGGCNFCAVHFEGAQQNAFSHASTTIESCGCDDELEAVVSCESDGLLCNSNRHVTFTYTAGGDYDAIVIQGGLTHFTSVCSKSSTGGLVENTTHPSVTNSNANVTRWETSDVEECDVFTVTINWNSTNGDPLITGQWTVKDGDGNTLASIAPLTCPL